MFSRCIKAFIVVIFALFTSSAWAMLPMGPVSDGLAGAVRSGVAREAVSGNPAALAFVNGSLLEGSYGSSSFANSAGGGKLLTGSIYDGTNPYVHAAIQYARESRSGFFRDGKKYYDRSFVRVAMGRSLGGGLLGGLTFNHEKIRDNGQLANQFWDVNAGLIYPLLSYLRVGLLGENLTKPAGGDPMQVGLGAKLALGYGISLRGDIGKIFSGDRKGQRFWAGSAEVTVVGSIQVRAGLFDDAYKEERGHSFGLSWVSPRSIIDYGFMQSKFNPQEKIHEFSLTIFM